MVEQIGHHVLTGQWVPVAAMGPKALLTAIQKKPYTAVTVTVERLTDESLSENDLSGIPDLVEIVNLQETGPTEAARAIRKKLKYGNLHRQLRALTILDGLIQNAGPRFQRTFADEMLLERLRFCGTAEFSDPEVKKKCAELFRSWAVEYKNVRGMERIASLYNVSWPDLSRNRAPCYAKQRSGTSAAQTCRHPGKIQGAEGDREPLRRR